MDLIWISLSAVTADATATAAATTTTTTTATTIHLLKKHSHIIEHTHLMFKNLEITVCIVFL